MKNRLWILLGGTVFISTLALSPAEGLPKKKAALFSGVMNYDFGAPLVCGEFTCPGGYKPDPNACYRPVTPNVCSEGSNFHMRDRGLFFLVNADDDRAVGYLKVIGNWNWRYIDTVGGRQQYSGPMWGTFTLEVSGGGTWEGSWTGNWDGTGDPNESTTLSFVGHGEGGNIDGMQIKIEATGGFLTADVQGRIQ